MEKEVCVYEEGDAAVTFLPLRTKIRLTPTKLARNSQIRDFSQISKTGSEASMFFFSCSGKKDDKCLTNAVIRQQKLI